MSKILLKHFQTTIFRIHRAYEGVRRAQHSYGTCRSAFDSQWPVKVVKYFFNRVVPISAGKKIKKFQIRDSEIWLEAFGEKQMSCGKKKNVNPQKTGEKTKSVNPKRFFVGVEFRRFRADFSLKFYAENVSNVGIRLIYFSACTFAFRRRGSDFQILPLFRSGQRIGEFFSRSSELQGV